MSNSGRIIFTNNTIITCDISNNIFSHNSLNNGRHMKYLNISNNMFKIFMTDTDGTIFATFTSLEVIDMSFNNIFFLPTMLLRNSHKLRHINASNNRPLNWMVVDLSEMPNLITLDLSENKCTTSSEGDRNQFEKAFQNPNLSINLFRNGITCTCDNQEFLIWIQKHKTHFLNLKNYICSTKSTYFDFKYLRSSLAILKKQCASYLGWYIACAVSLATFLAFIISVLLVRNK